MGTTIPMIKGLASIPALTVSKTDGRHKLGHSFKYKVITKPKLFLEIRAWCWEQWGSPVEAVWFDHYVDHGDYTNKWSFDTEHVRTSGNRVGVIYLKSDEELAWFNLRWAT